MSDVTIPGQPAGGESDPLEGNGGVHDEVDPNQNIGPFNEEVFTPVATVSFVASSDTNGPGDAPFNPDQGADHAGQGNDSFGYPAAAPPRENPPGNP